MNARNKPLVDIAKKVEQAKREPKHILTYEERYAQQMDRALPGIAAFLGVCPECFEDLREVDGKMICLACEAVARATQGGNDGSGTGE